jgi:hypothetical protein
MFKYTYCQVRKIDIDKWCEGNRLENDPGQNYILDWIDKNAAWFRSAWNHSLCQSCTQWRSCGHQVLNGCEFYRQEELGLTQNR